MDGTIVEGHRKPTIETGLHLAIYRNREEVNAVIHTHPMYSMVYATQGKDIPLIIDEAARPWEIPVNVHSMHCLVLKNWQTNVKRRWERKPTPYLLHSHGAVCVGENMDAAFKVATVLEATARILYMIEATGGKPAGISPENVAVMKDFAKNHYGQGK